MGKWASDKKQKMIFENWRGFLNEVEEEPPAPEEEAAAGGASPIEKLLGADNYVAFVDKLGGNIQDPKVQSVIAAGLKDRDGDASDDVFGFEDIPIPVVDLKPTQMEIDIDKSMAFPYVKNPKSFIAQVSSNGPFTLGSRIITFNGKYIIDGHHRWSGLYVCNKGASINATNLTISGLTPEDVLKAVQMAIGFKAKKIPIQKVEGSNLLKMGESEVAAWIQKNVPPKTSRVIRGAGPEFVEKLKQEGGAAEPAAAEPAAEEPSPGLEERKKGKTSKFHRTMVRQILPAFAWSNIASMRQTSQAVDPKSDRGHMPQTGGVEWKEPLAKGQIDVKPPFAKAAEALRRASKLLERAERRHATKKKK